MKQAVGNDVVELNAELEKFSTDIQFIVNEVKQNVEKTLSEFHGVQSSHGERLSKIEDAIKNEVENFKGLFQELEQKFDVFKQETTTILEKSSPSKNPASDAVHQLLEEHAHRLSEMEQAQEQLRQISDFSPEKLREELVAGIRMLGDRVSKIIEEINERMDHFSDEIETRIDAKSEPSFFDGENLAYTENENFAPLKESDLVESNDFEVVPRQAIAKLTELFKKQSTGVKNFIQKHEQKMFEFENLLRTYDEENTRLLELLDKRVKRHFWIFMLVVLIVIATSVVLRIF